MAPQQSGGRRPVDAEINLVPFIDLLCSLIAFLLMTAVWAQISSLEVQQAASSAAIAEEKDTLNLRIFVLEKGFKIAGKDTDVELPCLRTPCVERAAHAAQADLRVASVNDASKAAAGVVSHYDFAKLSALVKEKHGMFPDERDVYIDVGDDIPYDDMIRTMDTCMDAGFTNIALGGSAE